MPRLSQTDLDARRRQIREAANRCFARKGVQATTMREIFAEAGLSAGAVYNYFKTKEELIEAGIIESTRENIDTIVEAAETMSFREIIELFLADLEASAHDGRAKATPMIHAEVAIRPDLLRKFQKGRADIRRAAREQVARLRPDLEPARHATLVDFVFALYQGLVTEVALEETPNLDGLREIIDLVLATYGKPR
jgi:TetR/AcrR family transcriptional regulator, transcriptional repressor of aconitase